MVQQGRCRNTIAASSAGEAAHATPTSLSKISFGFSSEPAAPSPYHRCCLQSRLEASYSKKTWRRQKLAAEYDAPINRPLFCQSNHCNSPTRPGNMWSPWSTECPPQHKKHTKLFCTPRPCDPGHILTGSSARYASSANPHSTSSRTSWPHNTHSVNPGEKRNHHRK